MVLRAYITTANVWILRMAVSVVVLQKHVGDLYSRQRAQILWRPLARTRGGTEMRQLTQQEYDSLVALAKFGRYALDNLLIEVPETEYAISLGFISDENACTLTDLAKLPEGL